MNKAEEPKTTIAFVTELMRAVKNTKLDDPIQFAAFRQVAEEKLDAFLNDHKSYLVKRIEALRETLEHSNSDVLINFRRGHNQALKEILSIITKDQ